VCFDFFTVARQQQIAAASPQLTVQTDRSTSETGEGNQTRMTRFLLKRFALAGTIGLVCGVGAGCGDVRPEGVYPSRAGNSNEVYGKPQSIFGEGGLTLGGNKSQSEDPGAALGVNSYLWRASLDTVAFMPVTSADPFGGVIITDWYALPEAPDERFKMNVYILGRSLRSDAVRVALFRQVPGHGGGWQDAAVAPQAQTRIEDAILARARQLRFDTLQSQR
jgi:hypothetical protein